MSQATTSSPPVENDLEAPKVGLQATFDSQKGKGDDEMETGSLSADAAAPLRRDSMDQGANDDEEGEEEEQEEEEGVGEVEEMTGEAESSTSAATGKGKGKGKGNGQGQGQAKGKGGRASGGGTGAATKGKGAKGVKGTKGAAKAKAAKGAAAAGRKQQNNKEGGSATSTKGGGKGKSSASAGSSTSKSREAGSSEGNTGGGIGSGPSNTIFPLARVSRIVKVDREIEMTSKDAIWTIAVATELFIKHLTDSAYARARLEKKKTITYKELASASESQNEFFFLQDVIPQPIALNKAMEMRREIEERNYMREAGLVEEEEEEEEGEEGAEENLDTLPLLGKDSVKPAAGDQDDGDDIEMAEDADEMLRPTLHNGQSAVSNGSML